MCLYFKWMVSYANQTIGKNPTYCSKLIFKVIFEMGSSSITLLKSLIISKVHISSSSNKNTKIGGSSYLMKLGSCLTLLNWRKRAKLKKTGSPMSILCPMLILRTLVIVHKRSMIPLLTNLEQCLNRGWMRQK